MLIMSENKKVDMHGYFCSILWAKQLLYIKPRVGRTNLLNVSPIGSTFKRFALPTSGLIVLSRAADIFHALKGKKVHV